MEENRNLDGEAFLRKGHTHFVSMLVRASWFLFAFLWRGRRGGEEVGLRGRAKKYTSFQITPSILFITRSKVSVTGKPRGRVRVLTRRKGDDRGRGGILDVSDREGVFRRRTTFLPSQNPKSQASPHQCTSNRSSPSHQHTHTRRQRGAWRGRAQGEGGGRSLHAFMQHCMEEEEEGAG